MFDCVGREFVFPREIEVNVLRFELNLDMDEIESTGFYVTHAILQKHTTTQNFYKQDEKIEFLNLNLGDN